MRYDNRSDSFRLNATDRRILGWPGRRSVPVEHVETLYDRTESCLTHVNNKNDNNILPLVMADTSGFTIGAVVLNLVNLADAGRLARIHRKVAEYLPSLADDARRFLPPLAEVTSIKYSD